MRIHLAIVFLSSGLFAAANNPDSLKHWGRSIGFAPSRVVGADHYVRKWLKQKNSNNIELRLTRASLPSDSDAFAADYNHPRLSIALKLGLNHVTMHRDKDKSWEWIEPVDYNSKLGNIVSLYATFDRPLLRLGRFETAYALSLGGAYAHRKYSPADNIDNEFIGSRWLMYFGLGFHATWQFTHNLGIKGGIDFWHHSNGALNRPNKGVNYLAPSVSLVYSPYYETLSRSAGYKPEPFGKPYLYLNMTVGVGAKTLNEDWQITQFGTKPDAPSYRTGRFHVYPTYSFSTDIMCRYARKWASGIGIDAFYGIYSRHTCHIDNDPAVLHKPWSAGISAKHSAYYHNFSIGMAVGHYLYRHMGKNAKIVEKPYYEHLGVHYTIHSLGHISIGFNVKAHFTKADYTELRLSCPVFL